MAPFDVCGGAAICPESGISGRRLCSLEMTWMTQIGHRQANML